MARKIDYTKRDFEGLRQDLINYTQQYYPELINNFNDASLFSVLTDLNAAIGDNLHFHIDRSIQETVLQYAQQRSSIFNIARTYGLKIPGYRPSVAIVNLSITVPPANEFQEDRSYCGELRAGSQFNGGGTTFELLYDVNFNSEFNREGFVNRTVVPTFNENNKIVNYVVTKQEVVVNGVTKVFKRTINPQDVTPFFNFFLPERNVLGVSAIIQKDGTIYQNTPSTNEFISSQDKWYEVDSLVEDTIFVEDPTKPIDDAGVKVGKYIKTEKRFITEYTPEGFLKIQFGAGTTTPDEQLKQFTNTSIPLKLQNYQNNIGLGLTVQPNTTLFVQYRVGGGIASNIGVGAINQVGIIDFAIGGSDTRVRTNVRDSLVVTNVTAAIGGANQPTIEEVRNMVAFNFSAQKRAVTINDYKSIIDTMPGNFGAPAKVSISESNNKILIKILSTDTSGAYTQVVSNNLKTNLATYLSKYRMINDYISIEVAKVIDLEFEIFVVAENSTSQGEIITQVINVVSDYMDPKNRDLGQNVNISDLSLKIQDIAGVNTLTAINVYGKVGGEYSSSETSQRYLSNTTKQIELIDNTIYAEPDQIYQIRKPNENIKVRIKSMTNVNFG